jgi:hypothetical protein
MLASNHLAIKETCRTAIPPLMKKHGLGFPTKILMDETGVPRKTFSKLVSYVK